MKPTEILILGDSQLAFGSGPNILDFFDSFSQRCQGLGLAPERLRAVEAMSHGILGVRATGLHMWLSNTAKGTRMICVKDPAGLVNASTYGSMRYGRSKWVQIGESRNHRFCGGARSPIQHIMANLPEPPKLMILHFLGLSAYHWLRTARLERDLERVDAQLPKQTKCLFWTTTPAYTAKINAPRIRAQAKLAGKLKEKNHRCGFVAGFTPETLKAFQGNTQYYYKRKNGRVKDPYHTTPAGAERFLKLRGPDLCRGVVKALWPDVDQRISMPD